jgi:hypothetical protein
MSTHRTDIQAGPGPAAAAACDAPQHRARPAASAADPTGAPVVDVQLERAVRQTGYLRRGFYLVVLLVALAGQVSGAVSALHIPLIWAIPAVGALELGGVVVLADADVRRRLGERAVGSRILSAAIAAAAVAFNWLAHPDPLLGGFFAGMSLLGYLVWVTHAGNSRRDRLRALGQLPPTTPAYEIVGHWLRHPRLTHRAKALAKANPALGLYQSIAAARAEIRAQRRRAAICKVLHRKIRAAVDPATADIAVAVYDLDTIADRLAASADYDVLTALIAQDLAPARLAIPAAAARTTHDHEPRRPDVPATAAPQPATGSGLTGCSDPSAPVADLPVRHGPAPAAPRGRVLPHVEAAPADMPITGASVPAVKDQPHDTLPAVAASAPGDPRSRPGNASTQAGGLRPAAAASAASAAPSTRSPAVDAAPAVSRRDDPQPDHDPSDKPDEETAAVGPDNQDDRGERDAGSIPQTTAAAVAYWLTTQPGMHPRDIAVRIGRSERTVRRHLSAPPLV